MSNDIDSSESEKIQEMTYRRGRNTINRQQFKKINLQKYIYWILIKIVI